VPCRTERLLIYVGHTSFHSVGVHLGVRAAARECPTVVAAGGLIRELMIACTEAGLPPAQERRIRAVLIDRSGRVEVQPLSLPRAEDPLAAHSSVKAGGPSRTFYQRKRSERPTHTQALLALARRLVDVLWALLRDGRLFTAAPPPRAAQAA